MTDKKNFETALRELEKIVDALENSSMPLEEAMETFEKGVGLARYCSNLLDQAEKRVKLLTEEGNNQYLSEE